MEGPDPILICPTPMGLNRPTVESLSSYVQRLATANYLSIASSINLMATQAYLSLPRQINSRFLKTLDTQLTFISSPLLMTNTPWDGVRRLSFSVLFTAFYGPLFSDHTAIHTFFSAPYGNRSIETTRRWCPPCLLRQTAYQSLWQMSDVTVCLSHRSFLRTACASCQREVSVLQMNSVFGRCDTCYADLSAQTVVPAPQRLWESQIDIQSDYAALLSGQLALFRNASYSGWRPSLIFLRERKGLTREELATILAVSPSTINLLESEKAIVSLRVIIRAARYLAGSLEALSHITMPLGWLPRGRTRPVLLDHNRSSSPATEQQVSRCIMAALHKLQSQPCKLTISRLATTAGIKQRALEEVLRDTPALRHRFKVSKELNRQLVVRQRLTPLLSGQRTFVGKRLQAPTIESACKTIGITKQRLRENKQVHAALKAQLQTTRAAVAAVREQRLIRQLRRVMERRGMLGLTCTRRAISVELNCEFKNYPRVYTAWKKLRGL